MYTFNINGINALVLTVSDRQQPKIFIKDIPRQRELHNELVFVGFEPPTNIGAALTIEGFHLSVYSEGTPAAFARFRGIVDHELVIEDTPAGILMACKTMSEKYCYQQIDSDIATFKSGSSNPSDFSNVGEMLLLLWKKFPRVDARGSQEFSNFLERFAKAIEAYVVVESLAIDLIGESGSN
jgi:hypothetical protein